MKKIVTLLVSGFFVLTVLLGATSTAYACSCVAVIPQEESFEKSKAVFSGTVLGVTLEENPVQELIGSGHSYKKVKIDVGKAWKGISTKTVTVGTAQHGAACGYDFEVGTKYLVYARGGGQRFDTDLSAGLCGRTMVLATDKAQSDLEKLGEGEQVSASTDEETVGTTTDAMSSTTTENKREGEPGFWAQILAIVGDALKKLFSTIMSALSFV